MADEHLIAGMDESEDLFGFDELYKPSVPKSPKPNEEGDVEFPDAPTETPVFEENDDLFNFDEVGVEAKLEEAEAIEEELAEALNAPGAEPVVEAVEPPVATVRPAAPAAPALRPAPAPAAPAPSPVFSLRSATTWMLLLFTAVNLAMIGFTWGVSGKMRDEVRQATDFIVQATSEIQETTDQHVTRLESFQTPLVAEEPSFAGAFDRVRQSVEAGEFGAARRQIYSLLAVVDQLDPDLATELESTSQFLLADIALEEALAARGVTP